LLAVLLAAGSSVPRVFSEALGKQLEFLLVVVAAPREVGLAYTARGGSRPAVRDTRARATGGAHAFFTLKRTNTPTTWALTAGACTH
jgi:hypothetical protein